MKKLLLVITMVLGLGAFVNADVENICSEKGINVENVQKEEKIKIFKILVLDRNQTMFFPKCGIYDYIKGENSQIKIFGTTLNKIEELQLKAYFDASKLRGMALVFSSVKKLSDKKQDELKKEFKKFVEENAIKNYIFLDEE